MCDSSFTPRSSERFTNLLQQKSRSAGPVQKTIPKHENHWGKARPVVVCAGRPHPSCHAQLANMLFLHFIAPRCGQRLPCLPAAKESKYPRCQKAQRKSRTCLEVLLNTATHISDNRDVTSALKVSGFAPQLANNLNFCSSSSGNSRTGACDFGVEGS